LRGPAYPRKTYEIKDMGVRRVKFGLGSSSFVDEYHAIEIPDSNIDFTNNHSPCNSIIA